LTQCVLQSKLSDPHTHTSRMDKNRPNNARKATDNKNPTASRPENDENKQPSQTTNKNGVRQTSDKRADSKKPDNSASVLAKGPQATAEQLRMAQMSQVASASDIILAEKIKQVCSRLID
jgi:hypothetical protein